MAKRHVAWNDDALELVLELPEDGPVLLLHLGVPGSRGRGQVERTQPLVEVLELGQGRHLTNPRASHTAVGQRLRVVDLQRGEVDRWRELRVRQRDAETGLEVTTVLRQVPGTAAVRTWTEVSHTGTRALVLQAVTSLATGALLEAGEQAEDLQVWQARSEWCGESRWAATAVRGREGLPDINTRLHEHESRGALGTTSRSTWSSGEWLPTGVLENVVTGRAWAWQVEHNGAWHWEVDSRGEGSDALALLVGGPDDVHHAWTLPLAPGATFTTVPVSIAVADGGHQGALAALTAHRRHLRRDQPGDAGSPLVFNDYMNTLMGDPTTERLLPLIDAAAAVGAQVFCIDAGWYDDTGHWWDSVGEWEPSASRFPDGGLRRVLRHIEDTGMVPGLWLEPEVVGVRSAVAQRLPDAAFLQRHGRRVVEHSRYHLDLRHPEARGHLDAVVDRLVNDYGVGYFKLDYNITPGAGTDAGAPSPGHGLLEHNRAHLAWLDSVLRRHPDVVLENCASGAMRMDWAMMSRLQLQSTSDQQDFRRYATIAAAAPASLLPEQAANWAYPRSGDPLEHTAFTMVNGLAGRLYLSGYLNQMRAEELALIAEGAAVHQRLKGEVATALPFWPLGLPAWDDEHVALGLRSPSSTLLALWQRGSAAAIQLPVPHLQGRPLRVDTAYPTSLHDWAPIWDADAGVLTVHPGHDGHAARLLRLVPTHP